MAATDDKTDTSKTGNATVPATSGHQFAHGDLDALGDTPLTDGETAFLAHFPNPSENRTLAIELVNLSRKVK